MKGFIFLLLALPTFTLAHVDKKSALEIKQFVKRFHRNTKEVMAERPQFFSADGKAITLYPLPGMENIAAKDFLQKKRAQRRELWKSRKNKNADAALIRENDRVEDLVDNSGSILKSLPEIERRGLIQAELKKETRPWAGWFWPYVSGSIAGRYYDESFRQRKDYGAASSYIMSNRVENLSDEQLKKLSPAEKYDLVTGQDLLTSAAWGMGGPFFAKDGYVTGWFGHCNGWSYASMMQTPPKRAITLKSFDGKRKVLFYPDDLKALATWGWATNAPQEKSPQNRFIGSRCDKVTPTVDANGRIKDADCFDTNPGTFLLALVNQIGISKRSFAMDASFDEEVWNYPVLGYSFFFFNPNDGEVSGELNNEVMIEKKDYDDDPFRSYRSSETKYIVGINLTVSYQSFKEPAENVNEETVPSKPGINQRYRLDLELNARKEIIGGEWYHTVHPDFLAVPSPDAKIYTNADQNLLAYGTQGLDLKEGEVLPLALSDAARLNVGKVSGVLVEKMIQLSRRPK